MTDRRGHPGSGPAWRRLGMVCSVVVLLAAAVPSLRGALAQTVFVPLPEDDMRASLRVLYSSTGSTIDSTISIVPTQDNAVVYYDHWEDGYEADLAFPVQSTTQVWGDNNPANGIPPGFSTDVLTSRSVVALRNQITVPRDPGQLRYDGRDRIGATRAVAVTRIAYPTNTGPVFAGAVEVLSLEDWGTRYESPLGEDFPFNQIFECVSLHVMASEDDTDVGIDTDGNGSPDVTVTLGRGENATVVRGIRVGATVDADKPVQVHLITGDIGARYESRWFALYPTGTDYADWAADYYNPVGTTRTDAPSTTLLYNPNASAITVAYRTLVEPFSGTVNVPAGDVVPFRMPGNSGAHFYTEGATPAKFFALGAIDAETTAGGGTGDDNQAYDWGFSLVPFQVLTPALKVGFAPGASDVPISANGSPVWVMAVEDTTLYVDYDGDPSTGPLTDPNGDQYNVAYTVTALESKRTFDPDRDQTGMRVYTVDGTLITGAWGQDPSSSQPGNPYFDVGYTVLPQPVFFARKEASIIDDDGDGVAEIGETLEYSLVIINQGVVDIFNLNVHDDVPAETTYVNNSSKLDGVPIDDDPSGPTNSPLDGPGYTLGTLLAGQTRTITYQLLVFAVAPDGTIDNSATVGNSTTTIVVETQTPTATPTCGSVRFTDSGWVDVTLYNPNDILYVEVDDADSNENATAVETVFVTLSDDGTGDYEIVTLTETGVNTGIFQGSVASSNTVGQLPDDNTLYAVAGDELLVVFHDPTCSGGLASDTATIVVPSQTKPLYLDTDDSDDDTTGDLDRVSPAQVSPQDTTTSSTSLLGSIAVAGTTSAQGASVSSLSFQHTPGSGSNRVLLVAVSVGATTGSGNPPSVTGVTYNTTETMTLVGSRVSDVGGTDDDAISYIYRLVNPSAGPANIVVSLSGSGSICAGATTFTGVDQTAPLGSYVANSGESGTATSGTVSSAAGEVVFSTVAWDERPTITVGAGQTSLWNIQNSTQPISGAASTSGGAASVTHTYTSTNTQDWAVGAVAVKPALASTPSGYQTVTVDTVNEGSREGNGTVVISHTTTSDANRLMLVGISLEDDNTNGYQVDSVTYGSQSLTRIAQVSSSEEARSEIWSLPAPASGTASLTVTMSGADTAEDSVYVGVITFSGVDQATPLGSAATATGYSTAASVTVSSAVGELVFDVLASDDDRGASVGADQTVRWYGHTEIGELDGVTAGASTEPGAASVTMSWTTGIDDGGTSDAWALCAVPVRPAPIFSATFTQTPALCEDVELSAGGALTVSAYVQVPSGTLDANPAVTVTLEHGTTTFATLTTPTATLISGGTPETITVAGTAASASTGQTVSSYSFSYDSGSTGSNRVLMVGISYRNDDGEEVSSVTYASQPMVEVGTAERSDDGQVYIFALTDPPTGSNTLSVTWTFALNQGAVIGAVTYAGVDQDDPTGTFASANGSSNSPSVTVASDSGQLAFGVVAGRTTSDYTVTGGGTSLWSLRPFSGQTSGSGQSKAGASPSVSLTWSGSNERWVAGGVSLRPATTPRIYRLDWSTVVGSTVDIPSGAAVELTVANATGTGFYVLYDSATYPSRVDLPTNTVIAVDSLAVYDAAYPNGNVITGTTNGQTVYVRAVVSDPFGYLDITSLDMDLTPPGGSAAAVTAPEVANTPCTRTYEYSFVTGVTTGTYQIEVQANEGYEGTVFDTAGTTFTVTYSDTGTFCDLAFTDATYTTEVDTYGENPTVYIRLTDIDQNLDVGTAETLAVSVTVNGGTPVSVTLTETGVNTGVFTGSLALTAGAGSTIIVEYTDPTDPDDTCSDVATVPAAAAAIAIQKTLLLPADGVAAVDDVLRYRITVTNPGNTTLTGVTLADDYPSAVMSYLSATVTPTNEGPPAGDPLTWALPDLAVGASTSIEIEFTATAGTSGGNGLNAATADSTQTDPVQDTASVDILGRICGRVIDDRDADGDLNERGSEPGIAGVTVTLYNDVNGNGLYDAGTDTQAAQTTTAADGSYSFPGLPAGNYVVVETDPATYGSTADTVGANDNTVAVSLSAGQANCNNDFLDSRNGAVSDLVWADIDGDGTQDTGEPGLAGVRVYVDTTNDGVWDADGADDILGTSDDEPAALTDPNGLYLIGGVPAGSATVRVDTSTLPSGFEATYDLDGPEPGTGSPHVATVTVTAATTRTDVDWGYRDPTPTVAVISRVEVRLDAAGVVLGWETASEVRTAAWQVWRQGPGGTAVPVTPEPVPAVGEPQGGWYRIADPDAVPGQTARYLIEEGQAGDTAVAHGPFELPVPSRPGETAAVCGNGRPPTPAETEAWSGNRLGSAPHGITDEKLLRLDERAFERLAAERQADAAHAGARAAATGRAWVSPVTVLAGLKTRMRIPVTAEGMKYLSAAAMAEGLGTTTDVIAYAIRGRRLQLTCAGEPVGVIPTADSSGLYFHGRTYRSAYTKTNVYWLAVGAMTPSLRASGRSPGTVTGGSYLKTVRLEQDKTSIAGFIQDPEDGLWVWGALMPGNPFFGTRTAYATLDQCDTGAPEAALTVRLHGGSDSESPADHRVEVLVNGALVGVTEWDGIVPHEAPFVFPAGILVSGSNRIDVRAVPVPGVTGSLCHLDWIEVVYPRRYAAVNDHLVFGADGNAVITVTGFSRPDILVFDLTDPHRLTHFSYGLTIRPDGGGKYSVSFRTVDRNGLYAAFLPEKAAQVAGTPVEPSALLDTAGGAEYLVIAPETLAAAAAGLVAHREADGLSARVVGLTDVYNTFNNGRAEPRALRAFLAWAYAHWQMPPRYVVLAGDGTYDYHGVSGNLDNLVPPLLTSTPFGLFASDVSLGDVGGDDGIPEIAVGRLPVMTAAELEALTAKIVAYEQAVPMRPVDVVLAADMPDAGGLFPLDADALAAGVLGGRALERIYLSEMPVADARAALFSALGNGAGFLNWIGHGGMDRLSRSGLLTSADVPGLAVAPSRQAVLVAATCVSGRFEIPGYDCLGEVLVLRPEGGCAAVWSPSALAYNELSNMLAEDFYEAVFQQGARRLGDAVLFSMERYVAPVPDPYGGMDPRKVYNLLGDPALRLQLP